MLAPGERIGRRYVLARLLGRGGMAEVWQAADRNTGDDVALKVALVAAGVEGQVARARLAREGRALGAVSSACVCALVEARADAEPAYLALELLDGGTLEDRLEQQGALPFEIAHGAVADVLRGLGDAHAAGILHRDVKPSNVALVRRGKRTGAKLLDLGAARLDDPAEATLTTDGAIVGTLLYAAPERLAGAPADARTDLYAAGLAAFRAVTGRMPFDDTATSTVARRHADALSLGAVTGARWPAAFEQFFRAILARDPAARPAGAAEARAAWSALDPRQAPRVEQRDDPPPSNPTATIPRGRGAR